MTFLDDPRDDHLNALDSHLAAVVRAAGRRDRSALPALREALEQALAVMSDRRSAFERIAAAYAGQPQSELTAAMQRALAPTQMLTELAEAATFIPDASLEPVLKDLSKRVAHEGVRDALAKVRATTPPSFGKKTVVAPPAEPLDEGGLAAMVAAKDHKAIMDAVTEASIGDLLGGLAQAVRQTERYRCGDFVAACGRYPEAEVLFVVRRWVEDADPCRREAAAMSLLRTGKDGIAPDPRTMTLLYRLLADREVAVAVMAISAIGQRTNRNFTSADLERMRTLCERHPSAEVRGAYSDVFCSPYVGGSPAPGALDVWCALTGDDDRIVRKQACGRLSDRFDGDPTGRIRATLEAAKTDASAEVRFQALAGLARHGRPHAAEIERELTILADRLECRDVGTGEGDDIYFLEDDGLGLVGEMVCQPSRRYVTALRRIVDTVKAAVPDYGNLDDVLEACRRAPRESFLSRFL